jgi:hypothetical protein
MHAPWWACTLGKRLALLLASTAGRSWTALGGGGGHSGEHAARAVAGMRIGQAGKRVTLDSATGRVAGQPGW